jgi:hypothetical protein
MTTKTRRNGLGGWSIKCVGIALMLVFCSSAFADPSKSPVDLKGQPRQKMTRKVCYTYITGSAIAQPCDRLSAIPTTAAPLTIIGNYPLERR